MERDKILQIFDKVLELSNQRKIDWKINGSAGDYYFCNISTYVISVYLTSSAFSFSVEEVSGKNLGTITYNRLFKDSKAPPINTLFKLAKNRALKIDESLDNLLGDLNKIS